MYTWIDRFIEQTIYPIEPATSHRDIDVLIDTFDRYMANLQEVYGYGIKYGLALEVDCDERVCLCAAIYVPEPHRLELFQTTSREILFRTVLAKSEMIQRRIDPFEWLEEAACNPSSRILFVDRQIELVYQRKERLLGGPAKLSDGQLKRLNHLLMTKSEPTTFHDILMVMAE